MVKALWSKFRGFTANFSGIQIFRSFTVCTLIMLITSSYLIIYQIEPRHKKTNKKWVCAQRKLRSAWPFSQSDQSSLSAWRNLGPLATHWVHSEDSDQTGRMPRLIWVFAGCTITLLVLSCRGSIFMSQMTKGMKPQYQYRCTFYAMQSIWPVFCFLTFLRLFYLYEAKSNRQVTQRKPSDNDQIKIEPLLDKTNKITCAPSEDSDQPWLPPSDQSLCCALSE